MLELKGIVISKQCTISCRALKIWGDIEKEMQIDIIPMKILDLAHRKSVTGRHRYIRD